jgi:hypothetical protein
MDAVAAAADAIHCLVPGFIFPQGFELYVSSSAQGLFYGFCNVDKVAIDGSFIKNHLAKFGYILDYEIKGGGGGGQSCQKVLKSPDSISSLTGSPKKSKILKFVYLSLCGL